MDEWKLVRRRTIVLRARPWQMVGLNSKRATPQALLRIEAFQPSFLLCKLFTNNSANKFREHYAPKDAGAQRHWDRRALLIAFLGRGAVG